MVVMVASGVRLGEGNCCQKKDGDSFDRHYEGVMK